jgi:hypothetical protein
VNIPGRLPEQDNRTPGYKRYTSQSAYARSNWKQLLDQDQECEGSYPEQVHQAAHEQQRHEQPAASQTEQAVHCTSQERSEFVPTPIFD